MALTVNEILDITARFAPKAAEEQVGDFSDVPGRYIPTKKVLGETDYIRVKSGGLASHGWIGDGGTLPEGDNKGVTQKQIEEAIYVGRLDLPRGAMRKAKSKRDGLNLLKEQLDSCGETYARDMLAALYGVPGVNPSATVNVGATTLLIPWESGGPFRAGHAYDVYRGANRIDRFVVKDRALKPDGSNRLSLTLLSGALQQWLDTDEIYSRGARDDAMISIEDVVADAALHGIATTDGLNWQAHRDTTTTDLDPVAVRELSSQMKIGNGHRPEWFITGTERHDDFVDTYHEILRVSPGGTADSYSMKPRVDGMEIVEDPFCRGNRAYMGSKKALSMRIYKDWGPDVDGEIDGAGSGSNPVAAAMISQTKYSFDIQMSCARQLKCTNRSRFGVFTALQDAA